MGFLFWKKKNKEQPVVEAAVEELVEEVVEAPVEPVVEAAIESSIEATVEMPSEAHVSEPNFEVVVERETAPESEPEPEPEPEPQPEPVVKPEPELEEVVLPKRSFVKGIKSLFTRIKFDPENLDDLEEVLIQADFGVAASERIVAEVKNRAKREGARTENELKGILSS
ncbi:MAG: hypothetical protein RL719_1136, partial [Actinomycetota bacterium]